MTLMRISPAVRVTEEIEGWLESEEFPPGTKLPSERVMSEMFDTNRTTLRSALQRVARAGLIDPVDSSYQVSKPLLMRDLHDLRSFAEVVEETGSELTSVAIGPEVVRADESIARRLQIAIDANVFRLVRIRSVDGIPINVEWTYLDAAQYPGFEAVDFSTNTLYRTLEKVFATVVDSGWETFSVGLADTEQAEMLRIEEGTPLFEIEGTTFTEAGKPVEAFHSVLLANKVAFSTTVTRQDGPSHDE